MAAKKIDAAPAAAPHQRIRVLRAVISFHVGHFDAAGHLLHEEPAPVQPIPVLFPFNVTPEAIQQIVEQIEQQLNQASQ